jgi:hypothetical protein
MGHVTKTSGDKKVLIKKWRSILLLAAVIGVSGIALGGDVDTTKKVKVFILAGQSNMEGKAKLELLDYQITAPETKDFFAHLHKDGKYIERGDVWINFLERHGNLTVGYGSPKCIGPELEFGNAVGDKFGEQVLLIKTAWGGKSLARDFRPPSSGLPSDEELQKVLAQGNANIAKQNEKNPTKKKPDATMEEIKATYGKSYRDMIAEVQTVLKELPTRIPDYKGQGYEIAGFVWFHGWNDMISPAFAKEYTANLANLIRDVRKDLAVPALPVVVGQMGQDGLDAKGAMLVLKDAQAAVELIPEFKDNVKVVKTDLFWDTKAAALFKNWRENIDEWKKVGSDYGYHYLGSAITYCKIGRALGDAMLEMVAK